MPNKQDRRGRSKGEPRYIVKYHWIFDCPAYRSLTCQARAVHDEFIRIYNGSNNGSLALSARDAAARCNISKNTATRVFRELKDKGFLEEVTKGGFSRKVLHATEYRLTHLKCDKTGQLPLKPFMRWKPEM